MRAYATDRGRSTKGGNQPSQSVNVYTGLSRAALCANNFGSGVAVGETTTSWRIVPARREVAPFSCNTARVLEQHG
jgi:hypothetical protein